MRTLLISALAFTACSNSGLSVHGSPASLGDPVAEVRLERRAPGVVPMNFFGADVGGVIQGTIDLSWALGDGFEPTTRLHQDTMYLVPCGHGAVRFDRLVVRGGSASGTLDSATGDVVLTALSEGDVNFELFGTYTTIAGDPASCATESPGDRPVAVIIHGHVRKVTGYELVSRCRSQETAVVVGVNGRMPAIFAFPKDATGERFVAVNAAYDAQATVSVRAAQPSIAQPSAETHDWAFTQPGVVDVVVDTALEVTGARQVNVVKPENLGVLRLDGWIPPNGGHGRSFELPRTPSSVELTSTTLPLLVPRYAEGRALGLALCAPPPESFYELTSLTPDVCTPQQHDPHDFVYGDGVGVAAKFVRDGRCHVRVGVAGHGELQTEFTVDVTNVAGAASGG